jgi:hypothetical protein
MRNTRRSSRLPGAPATISDNLDRLQLLLSRRVLYIAMGRQGMDRLKRLWEMIKPHYIWWVIATALLLYAATVLAYYMKAVDIVPNLLSQLASGLIVGGVFASLVKSYQFSDLYQKELTKLFTTDTFVHNMKEIFRDGEDGNLTIRNAFERLAARQDPALAKLVPASVEMLLPVCTKYSFSNYQRFIRISNFSRGSQLITIRDELQYDLDVYVNTEYKSTAGGPALSERPRIDRYTLTPEKGKPIDLAPLVEFNDKEMLIKAPVIAGTKYRLERVVELKYELFRDPNIHQQFSRFCKGLVLEIRNECPKHVSFTVTTTNFEKEIVPQPFLDGQHSGCKYEHAGLTFPYQGYIVTIAPNQTRRSPHRSKAARPSESGSRNLVRPIRESHRVQVRSLRGATR